MENLSHPLVVIFIVSWLIKFYLFGMQRASLKISRHNNISWKGIGEQLLPNWYPVTWVFIIGNYALLVLMIFIINWKFALSLFILSTLISWIIPIPYRFLYRKIFRKKVKNIKFYDIESGEFFEELLDNTNF